MSIAAYSGSSLVSRLHDRRTTRRILMFIFTCRAVSRSIRKAAVVALFGLLLAVSLLPLPCRGCRMTRAEAFDELYGAIDLLEAACLQRVGATSDHDRLAFLCGFEMVRDKVEQCEAFNDEEGGAE